MLLQPVLRTLCANPNDQKIRGRAKGNALAGTAEQRTMSLSLQQMHDAGQPLEMRFEMSYDAPDVSDSF